MERRKFLSTALAASAAAVASNPAEAMAQAATTGKPREFYEIRKYHLQSGPQNKLTESYVEKALIPALNRMGIAPVGAFHLDIGPETPTLYLLLPCASVETLAMAELRLVEDAEYMKAASEFWGAPAVAPAYVRVESSLHIAFQGWPKLTPPELTAKKAKRIFQLRTYESPSSQDHVRKVEMFHSGEFDIFAKAGMRQVFYSDTLIGPRMPNLTYMLCFSDMTELNAQWDLFRNDPAWKKLSGSPRYSYEQIVSNISNLILSPAAYSQI